MKCARTACTTPADTRLQHVDTGRRYCARCARKINEGSGKTLIPWPTEAGRQTYECACGCGTYTTNAPQVGLIHDGIFMDFRSPGNAFASVECKGRFVAAVRALLNIRK